MRVEPGEIRAVIGPNGAGKSTLFNVITGVLGPTAGEVRFKGEALTGLAPHEVCARGLSRTFQITALFSRLSALENVRLAAQARSARRWRILPGGPTSDETVREAKQWLDRLGLTALADTPAGLLSHGDQRLLEVAMALSQRPEVLLLDEPTQGLSVEETVRTVELLRALLSGGGLTVLLVEHDMEVVFSLAQRITVLHQGRVIADGATEAVRRDARVQEAYTYAAAHGDEMTYMPCYCGCGDHSGHRWVRDCFVKEWATGGIKYEPHGSGCDVCVSIALDVKAGLAKGQSLSAIRKYVDAKYSKLGPGTNTPLPPG
jgi:branched-chain amino acid transport system ATP-binding protein